MTGRVAVAAGLLVLMLALVYIAGGMGGAPLLARVGLYVLFVGAALGMVAALYALARTLGGRR